MDLPENYIVSCKTQKETNDVLEKIHPVKRGGDYWLYWEFICFSETDEDTIDIFHDKLNAENWFRSKNIHDYDILTFDEWREHIINCDEKPCNDMKEITYDMLTTHPYFTKLTRKQLIHIIDHMNYSGYERISGISLDEKYKTILKIFNNKQMKQKLIVPITDVLEIHKIACSSWKSKIANYLTRVNSEQNIIFTQSEVDEMFKVATSDQKPILVKIFGEQVKPIAWDRIKTGSKVMIKHTNQICSGKWNEKDPVDVVFFKTKASIAQNNIFRKESISDKYCTFHQDGNFILFSADNETDYITEVIEY